jgi:hypothetical protein
MELTMTELHKKTILIQNEHIRIKEKEIHEALRLVLSQCQTEEELEELQFWIKINRLDRYV